MELSFLSVVLQSILDDPFYRLAHIWQRAYRAVVLELTTAEQSNECNQLSRHVSDQSPYYFFELGLGYG